jgi:hypothetical protein
LLTCRQERGTRQDTDVFFHSDSIGTLLQSKKPSKAVFGRVSLSAGWTTRTPRAARPTASAL